MAAVATGRGLRTRFTRLTLTPFLSSSVPVSDKSHSAGRLVMSPRRSLTLRRPESSAAASKSGSDDAHADCITVTEDMDGDCLLRRLSAMELTSLSMDGVRMSQDWRHQLLVSQSETLKELRDASLRPTAGLKLPKLCLLRCHILTSAEFLSDMDPDLLVDLSFHYSSHDIRHLTSQLRRFHKLQHLHITFTSQSGSDIVKGLSHLFTRFEHLISFHLNGPIDYEVNSADDAIHVLVANNPNLQFVRLNCRMGLVSSHAIQSLSQLKHLRHLSLGADEDYRLTDNDFLTLLRGRSRHVLDFVKWSHSGDLNTGSIREEVDKMAAENGRDFQFYTHPTCLSIRWIDDCGLVTNDPPVQSSAAQSE